MIYEMAGMPEGAFWHNTKFEILKTEDSDFGEYRLYTVKIVSGNKKLKSGEETTFFYPHPHDFALVKGNILNA